MATYYIDPTAAAGGDGTIGSPFDSWSDVTWGGGNTYLQKAGTTYTGQIAPTVDAAGSAGAPTVISTYGGSDRAKILGTNQYQGIRLVQDTHHVTISGFEVYGVDKTNAGTGTTGIYIGSGDTLNCNNVRILNCHVHGMTAVASQDCNGIKYFGDNVEIAYCTVEDIPTDGIWGYGLAPKIHHNTVQRVDLDGRDAGDCLQITYACNGAHVHHNVFDRSNSASKQVMIISAATAGLGALIEDNVMIGHSYVSIQTSCVYSDQPGTVVRRNRLEGCYRAVYFHTGATSSIAESNLCLNNHVGLQTANATIGCTFTGNTVAGSALYGAYITDNTAVVKNNLFYQCVKGLAIEGTGTRDYNAYFGNGTNFESISGGGAIDANKVTADPLLTADYKPTPLSPLLGAGTHLGYTRDIERKQRSNPPSIGAYDYATLRTPY